MMSSKTKEKFWVEFKVGSNLRKNLLSFRIDEKDLNIDDRSRKRNLQFITRNTQAYKLFQKKLPIYLKDAIAQVYQEIDIESKIYTLKFLLDERIGALIRQIASEQKVEGKRTKKEKVLTPENKERLLKRLRKLYPREEENFYMQIKKKASSSLLDMAIIFSEYNLDNLVHYFDDQTIFRNSVFFDLFQHWFVQPIKTAKIDELISALKKKAGIRPGPEAELDEYTPEIVFRYEYLRRILKKIKKKIEIPTGNLIEKKTEEEWNKIESFLKENKYFKIDKEVTSEREMRRGHRPLEYLGSDWFEKNFRDFKHLFLFDMDEDEANEEIEKYKKGKVREVQEKEIERKARLRYLELIFTQLDNKEYFDLELDIKSEDYGLLYLYKKHNCLEKVDIFENIKNAINKLKEDEIRKIAPTVSAEPYISLEILKVIKKHLPSELSIFLLSKIYNVTRRKIRRIIESNRGALDKSSIILSRYHQLQIS